MPPEVPAASAHFTSACGHLHAAVKWLNKLLKMGNEQQMLLGALQVYTTPSVCAMAQYHEAVPQHLNLAGHPLLRRHKDQAYKALLWVPAQPLPAACTTRSGHSTSFHACQFQIAGEPLRSMTTQRPNSPAEPPASTCTVFARMMFPCLSRQDSWPTSTRPSFATTCTHRPSAHVRTYPIPLPARARQLAQSTMAAPDPHYHLQPQAPNAGEYLG